MVVPVHPRRGFTGAVGAALGRFGIGLARGLGISTQDTGFSDGKIFRGPQNVPRYTSESLRGGPNPVSRTLWERGYAIYREWWAKRLREHEAAVWRVRHGVE